MGNHFPKKKKEKFRTLTPNIIRITIDLKNFESYLLDMKTIQTNLEFKTLAEDEIVKALDDFENLFGEDDDVDVNVEPENPIVAEVARLISEYTNRFDEYCENAEDELELPEEIFDYEPEVMIERIAYEIFMDAVHDAMQEDDESE